MNPALRELGFSPADRVAVVHADDIGMCPSTLPALEELLAFGIVTSASAMVVAPAICDVAAWRQTRPEVDLGVHLTLTSEWDAGRWRPVARHDRASGLIDEQGCFHPQTRIVRDNATRDAVRAEMEAQVDRAVQLGLAPTHLDNHMHVIQCEQFQEDYVQLGRQRSLPAFVCRTLGNSAEDRARCEHRARQWEAHGLPVFDRMEVVTRPLDPDQLEAYAREVFRRLPAGLSCLLLHPAADGPELRRLAADWRTRVADFELFRRPALRDYIRRLGIQLISYQPLRDVMVSRRCQV